VIVPFDHVAVGGSGGLGALYCGWSGRGVHGSHYENV
jgi:hypothetical protein